ncbi:unnamed protein product [Malus baccata var. baccata]
MGDPLRSSRVSSQKQNREGVVGAQSGQYRVTVESNPECDGGPNRDVTFLASLYMDASGNSKPSRVFGS